MPENPDEPTFRGETVKKESFFLIFLLSTQMSNAAWTFSEKPYDMDSSKEACVAEITTQHNDLEFNFPKDGMGFPVVKMTNKFDREYFGARMFLDRSRIRFFAKDDSGQIEFYMLPQNAAELETVIEIVKRNSKLTIDKLYNKNGRQDSGSGEFSLSGSSAALNKLKDCLGGTFISSAQENLIQSVNQRASRNLNIDLGLDYGKYMDLGRKIYSGIQGWEAGNQALQEAVGALEEKRNDPEYKELSRMNSLQEGIISRANNRIGEIQDNENFYANSSEIISGLESDKANAESEERGLETSVASQESEVSRIEGLLSSLESTLSVREGEVSQASARAESLRGQIETKNGEISDIEAVLSASKRRENSLISQTRSLREAREEAKFRSDNSRTIKRDLEESLYRQYGGRPFEIELKIDGLNEEIKRLTAEAEVFARYQEEVEDVAELAERISSFNPGIERVETELNCFKSSQGAESARCLETSKRAIEATIRNLEQAKRGHEQNRCKRLFGIGSKKCKQKRDAAIRRLTGEIQEANVEKAALLERIRIIQTTGEDPQRAQTISGLEARLADLKGKRRQAIEATERKINSIRRPRRRVAVLEGVLNCKPNANRTCERIATEAASRLEAMAVEANRNSDNLVNERTAEVRNLENLNSDLRTKVDGLETRLFEEYRAASAAYDSNLAEIDSERMLQSRKGGELETAQIRVGSLREELGRANFNLREAQDNRDGAAQDIANLKSSENYDLKVSNLEADKAKLERTSQLVSSLGRRITAAKQRVSTIEGERDQYANEISNLQTSIQDAEGILAQIKPELDALNAEIQTLANEVARLSSQSNASKDEVRGGIELLRNRY